MALPQAMEEGGEGENLELQAAVPEDVQAVMAAAEDGDAEALSQALGEQHHITLLHITSYQHDIYILLLLLLLLHSPGLSFWIHLNLPPYSHTL
jgi:hypothetical protein